MKAEYRREVDHNYLILEAENLDTSAYQVRILVGNMVPALLKCRIQSMDGKCLVYYDITSRQSVAELYEKKKYAAQDVRALFGGILHALEEMGEYLLNPARLLLSPEFIYTDVEQKAFCFCCLPGYERDIREQLCALTEYLLPRLDHEDGTAVMLGYGVYRRVVEETFRLESLKEELYRCEETGENPEMWLDTKAAAGDFGDNLWREENCDMESYGRRESSGVRPGERSEADRRMDQMPKAVWEREPGQENKKQETAGRRILICVSWAAALAGVLTAGFLGYLPWLSVEILLGILIAGMGFGMLGSILWKRFHPKKPQPVRRLSEELGWNTSPEHFERMPEPEAPAKSNRMAEFSTSEPRPEAGHGEAPAPAEPENYGETVVLSRASLSGPASFVSREPGELATIYLKDDITVIGKLSTAADAVIPLPTVSRLHAKVRKREDGYYLSDLNSRNGTSVNGRLLQGDEEYQLQDEDEVDFAQARYVFLK